MSKHILFAATILLLCVGAVVPAQAQKKKQGTSVKKEVKFLDDISIQTSTNDSNSDPKAAFSQSLFKEDKKVIPGLSAESTIENADNLQLKYALLLDINVEQAIDVNVFKVLDEWMGTRYRLGGSTKDGIDCSAFTQILFNSLYGISLPRTAREQFDFSQRISRAELKQGDLVFFNTIGGVSHVGMYLQNNKFVHASTGGVTISDLYDDYWIRKFVGVGRVNQDQITASTVKP
ncbi:MAG: C40 family peptidase [Flavisolibacter sp.]